MSSLSSNENAADVVSRSADAARARVFLLRAAVSFIALIAYQFSGASSHLLTGLHARFADSWFPVHAIYIVISLFGLGALMLPFSLYEDFVIEARESGEETDFEEWTFGILQVIGMDLLAGTAFFLVVYGLLEGLPRAWWLVAAAIYGAINCIMTVAPMLQGPPEDELAELRDPPLRERLSAVLKKSGQRDFDVLRWNGDDANDEALLALQGFGKRRRVIISAALLRDFTADEIAALLAHEASHLRSFDTTRLNILSILAALFGFAATHALTRILSLWCEIPAISDLAAFPIFTGVLLAFSFAGLPLLNAFSRHREYVADVVAARIAGEEPLRFALEKLNDGGPAASPGKLLDLLLNSHPGLHQRLWRLNSKG